MQTAPNPDAESTIAVFKNLLQTNQGKKAIARAIFTMLFTLRGIAATASSIYYSPKGLRGTQVLFGGLTFFHRITRHSQGPPDDIVSVAQAYLATTHTDVAISNPGLFAQHMESLETGTHVILSDHQIGMMRDYLPLFAKLPPQAAKNTILITAPRNLAMNRLLFPGYTFVAATRKLDVAKLINEALAQGKHILFIPMGEKAEFGKLFKQFQEHCAKLGNPPKIIPFSVSNTDPRGYAAILDLMKSQQGTKATILVGNETSFDERPTSSKEQTDYYQQLFEDQL